MSDRVFWAAILLALAMLLLIPPPDRTAQLPKQVNSKACKSDSFVVWDGSEMKCKTAEELCLFIDPKNGILSDKGVPCHAD
jgi:hypothetical protein